MIGISSNFLHNISTCTVYVSENVKNGEFSPNNFKQNLANDPVLYYSDFYLILEKIHKKSNFDRNQLKLYTQHKYMYVVRIQ